MNDEQWDRIAKNIHIELAVHNMTRKQLADRLVMGVGALRRRMYGQTDWTYDELQIVADTFNLPVGELTKNPTHVSRNP